MSRRIAGSPLEDALEELGPARAVARRGDPETSWAAAQSVFGIRESQARIYIILHKWGPSTHEELIAAVAASGVKMSESGIRTRCAELVDVGLVEDSGERGLTKGGRPSVKWRAVRFDTWKARRAGEPLQQRLM